MAETIMTVFKTMILVQLFFSFAITMFAHAIPADQLEYVSMYEATSSKINNTAVASQIQGSLDSTTNLPLIDVGAMVFYSSNLLLDLLLNFFFAVPEMIFLLLNTATNILNIDIVFVDQLQAFSMAVIVIMYFIGLIQLLTGLRAGRVIS